MSETGHIAAEASRWVVRMQGDPPPAVLEEFSRWLIQSAHHTQAYLRASRTWVTADQFEPIKPVDELLEAVRTKLHSKIVDGTAQSAPGGLMSALRHWWRLRRRPP